MNENEHLLFKHTSDRNTLKLVSIFEEVYAHIKISNMSRLLFALQ